MTPTEVTAILRQFNEWRRGEGEDLQMPKPREIGKAIDAAVEMIDRLEAAEKGRDALRNEIACVKEVEFPRKAQAVADAWKWKCKRLEAERDTLHAKIEQMEKQEPFDADSDVFRGAFEAALKAGNWPVTRKGDGYRSPSAQIAWRIAFSTVNRLKLYLAPGAQGE